MSSERSVSPELNRRSGVRILLAPESLICDYVLGLPDISVETTEIGATRLNVVRFDKGDAGFIPGGSVALRVGRQRVYRVGFGPDSVLEIQTLDGKLIKRNYHMCVDCCANTGVIISHSQSQNMVTHDAKFQCSQNPEHQWELKNI